MKTLQQKQDELDKEFITCPKCKEEITWGESRKIGCLECYYQETKDTLGYIRDNVRDILREVKK